MIKPTIKDFGDNAASFPTVDGTIGLFKTHHAAVGVNKSISGWFDSNRRVVFVNGMDTTGDVHADHARGLSLLQACPVIGMFNAHVGFVADVYQCLTDKITLSTMQAYPSNFEAWAELVDDAYAKKLKQSPGLDKRDFVETLIGSNKATISLYRYYVTLTEHERRQIQIYCHSQGNLITSNALTGAALALGEASIRGLKVFSFGSPCLYWPKGLDRQNRAFTFDPISWMDYRFGFDSSKIGFKFAHGFDVYRAYDAEFTVNSFRWGSFGMTVSMDEQGLAEYCVSLGANVGRLRPIFERLIEIHWNDMDDVALAYTKRMRKPENEATLKRIAKLDPVFLHKLVYCMSGGTFKYVSSEEKAQIKYLQSLK